MILLSNNVENIGEFIKTERKKRGWSQALLADLAGVCDRYICDYERGKRKPHIDTLVAILLSLEYDIEIKRKVR